jgi:hypothetical protein
MFEGETMGELEVQSAASTRSFNWLASIIPVAFLVIAGPLTVAWTCALGLCTYDVISWLFE